MQSDPSIMRLGLIWAIAGAGLWASPSLAVQEPSVHAEVALEKSIVVTGEPLVIIVTVENATERALMLPYGDKVDVDWVVKTENGGAICSSEPPHGETLSLARTLSPGSQLRFSIVAYGTAAIKQPGRYQLFARYVPGIPEYHPPASPSPIAFEVLPVDSAALARRAQELHDEAVDQSVGLQANIKAARAAEELASMDYAGSKPLICDVLKRSSAPIGYAIRRLEHDPDVAIVNCLVECFQGAGPGMRRDAVEYALKDILRDQRDAKLRSRILAVAGAFAPEPNCPQLGSAEPPALVSYLDGPMESQTAACVAYAIRQVGDKKYVSGVSALVRHLGFRRDPDFWEKGEDAAEVRHDWYPAAASLALIGKPALPAVVELLGIETNPTVRANALEAAMGISKDDPASAVKVLRAAAARERDGAAKSRLLDAARKAAKMCPSQLRRECVDSLR